MRNKNSLTIYEEILFILATKNMVTTKSLLMTNRTPQPVYRSIRCGVQNNHIREVIRFLKYRGKKTKFSFLTITTDGLRYLLNQCSTKIPWLSYANVNISRLKIRDTTTNQKAVERFTRMVGAALVAEQTGADMQLMYLRDEKHDGGVSEAEAMHAEPPEPERWWEDEWEDDYDQLIELLGDDIALIETDEDDRLLPPKLQASNKDGKTIRLEATSLAVTMTNAYEKYRKAQGLTQDGTKYENGNQVFYHNSSAIKRMILQQRQTAVSSDFMFGRYAGILESRHKTVMLYMGTPFGFSGSAQSDQKDISVLVQYDKVNSRYHNVRPDDVQAAMIVSNAKMLSDVFHDVIQRRGESSLLGKYHTSYYIVPQTYQGIETFRELITTPREIYYGSIIQDAVKSGVFELNNKFDKGLFPLITPEGTLFSIGTDFDLKKIYRIQAIMERFPDFEIGILCKPYQVEYYKRIVTGVSYMTYD